jgi:hypothetical protein
VARAAQVLSFPEPDGGKVTATVAIDFTPAGATAAGDTVAPPPITTAQPEPPPNGPPVCAAVHPPCSGDVECSGMQRCLTGQCKDVLGAAGQSCDDSIDCGPGLYCRLGPHPIGRAGACATRKRDGEACTSSLQCVGVCTRDGVCASFCDGR